MKVVSTMPIFPEPHPVLPAIRTKAKLPSRTYWTRTRVLEAMRRFYALHNETPLSTGEWNRRTRRRRPRPNVNRGEFPSFATIGNYFGSMRAAWTAVGIDVNKSHEEYSDLEDWFIQEAIGILTRQEIAAELKRTPDAIHRRIYDLGLNTWERHGWTTNRVARVAGIHDYRLRKYMARGELPYLKGTKVFYIDPADLLVVEEIDWEHPPAELEQAVRRSLTKRLVALLQGQDWRVGSPYKVHQVAFLDRSRNKQRRSAYLTEPREKPTHIRPGDLVHCIADVPGRQYVKGRVGVVHLVYWTLNRMAKPAEEYKGKIRLVEDLEDWPEGSKPWTETRFAHSEPCWVARVEFKRQKRLTRGARVTYTLPLHALKRVEPHEEVAS
jgi:hypothetical protein